MSIQERVARGVDLLDEKNPGWRDKVNVDLLDVRTITRCVLGQLYGDYWTGTMKLGIAEGASFGFNADPFAWSQYAELTEEWRRVLCPRCAVGLCSAHQPSDE